MTTKTRSRASRSADQAQADTTPETTPDPTPESAPESAPEPTPEPKATVQYGERTLKLLIPTVTAPDGQTFECPHVQWHHSSEKAARTCALKLAAEHGLTLA